MTPAPAVSTRWVRPTMADVAKAAGVREGMLVIGGSSDEDAERERQLVHLLWKIQ